MDFVAAFLAAFGATVVVLILKFLNPFCSSKLPPSPPRLPIIGHLHLLGKLPHQSLQKLAERYGGLMLLKLGVHNTVVVSSADAARELLKTQDHVFASRPRTLAGENFGYRGSGLVWATYGDHWRNVRKLCTLELLTVKRVEMFRHVRKMEMSILSKEIMNHGARDPLVLTPLISDATFNIMTRTVMNKSYSTGSSAERNRALEFKDSIIEAFTVAGSNAISDFLPYLGWIDGQAKKISTIHKRLDEYMSAQLVEHRQQPGSNGDFMDVMLATKELSEKSIKSLCLDMIAAGTDTAAVTTEWALAELVRSPSLMLRVQKELEENVGQGRVLDETDLPKLAFLHAIIKETLRLHPPAPLSLPHESIQSCEVDGFVIPAGTRAFFNIYAIARDPSYWKEPLKFDPERFIRRQDVDYKGQSFDFLPFGSGRRSCPGIYMGITTVSFLLGSLLHGFDWSIPDGEDLDMSEEFGLTTPRLTPLRVVATPRLDPTCV